MHALRRSTTWQYRRSSDSVFAAARAVCSSVVVGICGLGASPLHTVHATLGHGDKHFSDLLFMAFRGRDEGPSSA
jgi:hypothetical protein